mgnify:CR=1 FL=1
MGKKGILAVGIPAITVLLAGCSEIDQPITKDSEGLWNSFIVYPLSWLIVKIAGWFGGGWGYGMAIILITILIRMIILPLMVSQMKSTRAMQYIQPELEKLKKKYSSKDAVTQEKLRQEQMLLLQKYNINPLAGCLPLLIQMPILIGFYHAIVRTEAIKGNSFLWFELAKPDPYFLLPLIAGLTTFLQQKILMKGQPANPQSQMMLWVMPVLILMFALYLPSALPLYWIIGNLFSIVQSYFIKLPELEESGARNATLKGSGGKKR